MTVITIKESSKEYSQKNKRSLLKWGSLLFLALLPFLFFAFFAKQFKETSLEIDLNNRKVKINTNQIVASPETANKIDPEKYYIDSSRHFFFKKPVSGDWNPPQILKGVNAFLDIKGIILTPEVKETILRSHKLHPFGKMLQDLEIVRYTTGDPLIVECTDQTTTKIAEDVIQKSVDSLKTDQIELDARKSTQFRKRLRYLLLGFEKLQFTNEFSVYVYDKSKLKGIPVKLSLANFAVSILGQMALNLDKLVANEQSVLAGVSSTIQNINIDGKARDFRMDRLYIITESKDRYYLVEIAFSPQTKSSLEIWSELKDMLNSFKVTN